MDVPSPTPVGVNIEELEWSDKKLHICYIIEATFIQYFFLLYVSKEEGLILIVSELWKLAQFSFKLYVINI